jgi:Cys-tRNA(Pro) deacylase
MPKEKLPVTAAIRFLKDNNIDFLPRPYRYEEKGGTGTAARELKVEEHLVVKTLVFEDEGENAFLVLMHGDRQVSTKALARELGVKSVAPCSTEGARRHTGYEVGGISPFGTRKKLLVYVEKTILDLDRIFINGGKRGFLVELTPQGLIKAARPTPVNVAI